MNFRDRIARWLSPRLARKEDRYDRMVVFAGQDVQWIKAEFPHVAAAVQRILDNDYNHWRAIDEEPVGKVGHGDIAGFREWLRAERVLGFAVAAWAYERADTLS
jgi:hypothetical protein